MGGIKSFDVICKKWSCLTCILNYKVISHRFDSGMELEFLELTHDNFMQIFVINIFIEFT